MALSRDAYEALEDIVGPENISEEPAVLDSYAREFLIHLLTGSYYAPRYEAIVLPESTEEVQAIVRTCNKYGVQFKARSSGFGWFNATAGPGAINIDLVRMNRILEINEKNMYAVVEAGVICSAFTAELNKYGLRDNIIGAGATTSALPLSADCGQGHTAETTSYDNRNILGVEWVTPDGEIVRLGSLGSVDEWFCGDGPGPSLRGVIRGISDALGGLGVFTKAAAKVYHWAGPRVPEIDDVYPYYGAKLPETIKPIYADFPSWEQFEDTMYAIGESEVAFSLDRIARSLLAWATLPTHEEEAGQMLKYQKAGITESAIMATIVADSQREFDYKEKVIRQIITENGGRFLPLGEEPDASFRFVWGFLNRGTATRGMSGRVDGMKTTTLGAMSTLAAQMPLLHRSHEVQQKYVKMGIATDIGIRAYIHSCEHGHYAHLENILAFPNLSDESRAAALEYGETASRVMKEQHLATRLGMGGDRTLNEWGPLLNNYHLWQRKIKKAFDPNLASESLFYTMPDGVPISDWDGLKAKSPDEYWL